MLILNSRAWIVLFKYKSFRKLAGGHWVFVTKDKLKYWDQHPRKVDFPNLKKELKENTGYDNIHESEYFGDEFIDCRFVGSVGGIIDSLWKSLRGSTK